MVCKDVKAGMDTWGKRWRRQSRHSFLYETITSHYLLRTVWYTFINYDSANGISRIGARMPLSLIRSSCFCIDGTGMAGRWVQPRLKENLKSVYGLKRERSILTKTQEEQKCWCLFFVVRLNHFHWIPLLQSPLMQEARQSRRSPERARGVEARYALNLASDAVWLTHDFEWMIFPPSSPLLLRY